VQVVVHILYTVNHQTTHYTIGLGLKLLLKNLQIFVRILGMEDIGYMSWGMYEGDEM